MSEKSKENKLLDLVTFYYRIYKDCEIAYDNAMKNKGKLQDELRPLVKKGDSSTQEFKNIANEFLPVVTSYNTEVSFASSKFFNAADIYLKVEEKELPTDMAKDYIILKNAEYKPAFSVKNKQFVRNSEQELPEIPQDQFDMILNWLKQEFQLIS